MMIEYLNGLNSIMVPMLSRRRLLQLVIASGTVAASGAWLLTDDIELTGPLAELKLNNLSDQQLLIMSLFSVVMLQDTSINTNQSHTAYLKRLDQTIGLLPQAELEELQKLLDILTSRLGRLLLTRRWIDLNHVEHQQIDQVLISWRDSSLPSLNKAYQGLKKLVMACWYADETDWSAINYPGPPSIAS